MMTTPKQTAESVVVPREPTAEMIAAGMRQIDWCRDDQVQDCANPFLKKNQDGSAYTLGTSPGEDVVDAYRAMLAAAPTALVEASGAGLYDEKAISDPRGRAMANLTVLVRAGGLVGEVIAALLEAKRPASLAPEADKLQIAAEALMVADQHIRHMAAWISKTNSSDTPLHGYSFEALGEDKWKIDQALAALRSTDQEKAG